MIDINILLTGNKNTLVLSKINAAKYKINSSRMLVRIGAFVKEMVIEIDNSMPDNTIGLPQNWMESSSLPQPLSYDLIVKNRSLMIGPIIAFVAFRQKQHITSKRLELFRRRFSNYEDIKGLVYICAANGINPKTKTIEGYYYNPAGKSAQTRWVHGIFPYPNVVYKRKPIDAYRYYDLISHIGDRIINSFFFLKADVAEMIERDSGFQDYFPYTEMMRSSEQLQELIARFGSVYLKPNNGKQGIGIYKVSMDEDYLFQFTNRRKQKKTYPMDAHLDVFIKKCMKKKYIIQQGIQSANPHQSVDFRVYVQKNSQKQWVCQGMIGRLGKKGTIITNLHYAEKILSGYEAIQQWFRVDSSKAKEIEKHIYERCIGVCKELDKKIGNYGDVAVDVIVDENYQAWILEINKDFGYESIKRLKDRSLLRTLYTTPFSYAKSLAGFTEDN